MSWLYAPVYLALVIICIIQSFYPVFMILAMLARQSKLLYAVFHTADKSSKRHGGELVAQIFKNHGVERIFTLPGGHVSPVVVASNNLGISVIDVRHEATAVFAADATARMSGVPGVAVVTAGPGLTNTVTAIKNAQMAESPVVVVGGAAATMLKGRGSLQDIDQLTLLKAATKKCFSVDCVRDIVPTMREAFRVSQVGTPGPVFVELPVDILYPYNLIGQQFAAMSEKAKSLKTKLINAYTNYRLQYIFADAWKEQQSDPHPVSVKSPTRKLVIEAAKIVGQAKRPLIIMGSQAMLPPNRPELLLELVDSLGFPCYLNGAARGVLGENHKLHFRHARKEAVREADCVLLLGATCDFRLSYGRIFKRPTAVISVNRGLSQAKLNAGIFWQPALAVESDIGNFLKELHAQLGASNDDKHSMPTRIDEKWIGALRKRDDDKDAKIETMSLEPCDKHLNPLKVLLKLRETFAGQPKTLVVDGGDFVASASYIMKPSGPHRWLDPGPFGTLGCGAGFALAAGLHNPGSCVVAIMGDGAFGYAIPELDTLVRHKVPVYFIIGNDACWTQIAREQVPMLGSPVGCELDYTNYHRVAEGFGALGYKLESVAELTDGQVLSKARDEMNKTKKPVVVNVLTGKTQFRDGSISV